MSNPNAYADSMYVQGVVEEKRPLYIEFIRKVLQCYQMNKNLFTAYAPDVQFEGIKSSKLHTNRVIPSGSDQRGNPGHVSLCRGFIQAQHTHLGSAVNSP